MTAKFIPAGRTSMVKTGKLSLQVQTEYAFNPTPRITTTILQNGQVLHKVQRDLDHPIGTLEDQKKAETTIVKQHADIMSILRSGKATRALELKIADQEGEKTSGKLQSLRNIPGVQNVYEIDKDGNFTGARTSEQFQASFGAVLRNIRELLSVFLPITGADGTREKGVYEVEKGRLYLVSVGIECYCVVVGEHQGQIDYGEKLLDVALAGA